MPYQLFNIFGTLRVERGRVICLATAITESGKAVEKTADLKLEEPITEIDDGEIVPVSFVAYLESGKRYQVAFQQLAARNGGPDLRTNKQVRKVLQGVLDQFGFTHPVT